MTRAFLLSTVVCLSACGPAPATYQVPSLRYVTSVDQVGPVAYRDPLGAISPDGKWLAYTSDRFVDVIPSSGGPVRRYGAGVGDLRQLTWMADSRSLAVLERTFDRASQTWYEYRMDSGERTPLWPAHVPANLRELSWRSSADSLDRRPAVAGILGGSPNLLVSLDPASGAVVDTLASADRLSSAAWMPDGRVACLSRDDHEPSLQMPCGETGPEWTRGVYGPVAFSEESVYYAIPDERGRQDVWRRPVSGGAAARISSFDRDAYAPQTTLDGGLFFKSQDYRVFIAMAPAEGGPTSPLTTFMSETPSWNWSSSRVSFTWGDWRRQADDLHYPDITQHIGYIDLNDSLPASEPSAIVRQSASEDQSMHWSPNGKWIVFHSHVNGDDVWLVPADGSAEARPITQNGAETGWPRWSPDGNWIQYPSYRRLPNGGRRSDLFVLGIDQNTGEVTREAAPINLEGFSFDAQQGEWLGGSDEIVFEASEGPNSKLLYRVPRSGGIPRLIHRFGSPQVFDGISASPDGRWVAFVAPDPAGWLQIHRVPAAGGLSQVVTTDASHKTQPTYSPDGAHLAFTVFSYKVHFWAVDR
jgi:WD40-like Beta Propeller Repeat